MAMITFIRGGSVHLDMSAYEAGILLRVLPIGGEDPYCTRFLNELGAGLAAGTKALRIVEQPESPAYISLGLKS
jgi:hypothetical protein